MTDTVTVTTVVRTDPASAFAIFTGEIDRWWSRGPLYRDQQDHALRRRPPAEGRGRNRPRPGVGARSAAGDVVEERTEVEIRFTAIGDGTRVTVEHRGLPQRGEAYRSQIGLWWGRLLTGFPWRRQRARPRRDWPRRLANLCGSRSRPLSVIRC